MENNTVNKEQLKKALEIVKPGLASKEQIEQSTSFAFIKGRVVTYNDEVSLSHPVPGLDLTGAILADNLYKFLHNLKKDTLVMELVENEVILHSGGAKAGLLLQAEIKLPLQKEIGRPKDWVKIPEHLIEGINFCMTSCGKDMSRPKLTCVHVNQEGFVQGSDSYRIAHYDVGEKIPVPTFLLPATSAIEVVKLKPIEMTKGKSWIHFRTEEDTMISCRLLNDTYPSTEGFFKDKGVRVIFPKITEDILKRAQVFSKREHLLDESVHIKMGKGRFMMKSRCDTGWFREQIIAKYKGDIIEFDITPYLLKGILAETREFKYDVDRLVFRGERWYYVSMLRISKK
jgi:hypothetical protein